MSRPPPNEEGNQDPHDKVPGGGKKVDLTQPTKTPDTKGCAC